MKIRNPALVVLALALLRGPLAGAQESNGSSATNQPGDVVALVVSNMVAQADELAQTNEFRQTDEIVLSTNDVTQSNSPIEANPRSQVQNRVPGDGRGQPGDRQIRRRDRQNSDQPDGSASAGATQPNGDRNQSNASSRSSDSSGRPDYSNFALIAERNIFDPNRFPHQVRTGPVTQAPRVESFALVGVMSYDKGTFAFFDGSRPEYQKALKLDDTIAGYRVASIDAETVKLAAGTNQVELRVGMQLRREEEGEWRPAAGIGTYAASSTSATSATDTAAPAVSPGQTDAASGGPENEILKRLMQRREQE